MRRPWRIAAVSLFLGAVLLSGFLGDRVLAVTDEARERLRQFTELVEAAHERYGEEVPYSELVNASIEGMIRTLDPHTAFLTELDYQSMRDRQESSFSGLGILVGVRDGALTVITPLEGTPASRKGIRAGDVISTIEGEPTETMSVDEAVRRLKGPKGTSVTIEIARRGMPDLLEIEIVRDEIPQNSVRYAYMLDAEVGYVSLTDFNRGTGHEMENVLDQLRTQGMKKLVLDLRANGGGLLDQAIAVADLFVPAGGKIVETRGRTRESFQDFHASDSGPVFDAPIVVLVGGGTASAAEILSGAIQDHDIGLVVGTPTWGKGLVQTVYSLSYGNGLSVTTAKYYTPSGRLIQRDYSSWYDYQYHDRNMSEPAAEVEVEAEAEAEAFYTDLGRKVYGGGGITPDVISEPDELPPFVQYLLARSAFFNFAVELHNRRPVTDRSWEPDPALLDEFEAWLLDQELIDEGDLADGLAVGENRDTVLLYLRAEVLGAAFGLEARHRVLIQGDSQVVTALEQLDEAEALLAERRRVLEGEPGRGADDLGAPALGSLN